MPEGSSWPVEGTAPGTDGYRIRRALERGDVQWEPRCDDWLSRHFDSKRYSQRAVVALLCTHVRGGGSVKGQKNASGEDYDAWFSIQIEMDGQQRFIKFVIEPEEDDNPGLLIVSTHPPH